MHKILIIFLLSFAARADWESHFVARTAIISLHAGIVGSSRVLLLGDSNTESYWWSFNNLNACWNINAGMGGARVHDIAIRSDYIASQTRPKIMHLMIGTNDLHEIPPTFEADMQVIFDAFARYNAKIVVWPIPPFTTPFGGSAELANRSIINNMLANVAYANGAHWDWWWPEQIEGVDGYAISSALNSDGVHFNRATQVSRYNRINAWNTALGGC